MSNMFTPPKTAAELRGERFAMLEDIARELGSEVTFPICFDAAIRVGKVLRNEAASLQAVVHEVQRDPLITAKLLRLANSAAYNAGGKPLVDVGQAVARLGFATARSAALACAMQQMVRSRELVAFDGIAKRYWLHTLKAAAIARVLARKLTRIDPELAMLGGLVHDLGAFYMLERATRYPELVERPATVHYLVAQWHDSVGTVLLDALGLPEDIIEAVRDNDTPRTQEVTMRSLSDVLYVANIFADGVEEMRMLDLVDDDYTPPELSDPRFTALQAEFDAACDEFVSHW
ncbi:MAG TPA: HDOD domain-containing protein [Chitinolyticbacter sp.]|nr:HDOD domain-containing protein [Chitinolyticbacter sp.]